MKKKKKKKKMKIEGLFNRVLCPMLDKSVVHGLVYQA